MDTPTANVSTTTGPDDRVEVHQPPFLSNAVAEQHLKAIDADGSMPEKSKDFFRQVVIDLRDGWVTKSKRPEQLAAWTEETVER